MIILHLIKINEKSRKFVICILVADDLHIKSGGQVVNAIWNKGENIANRPVIKKTQDWSVKWDAYK